MSSVQSPSLTPLLLKQIANTRLLEAKTLYTAGLYDGCVYLCGYVVETALKAVVCKTLNLAVYPVDDKYFKTHKADQLKILAGLSPQLTLANQDLFLNWSKLTSDWDVSDRYKLGALESDARELLDALESGPDGFYNWIQQIW